MGGRVIPKFQGNVNTPYKTNEDDRRFKMDKIDHPDRPKFPPPPQPIFEVKVNDNILGSKIPAPAPIYPATYVPIPNPMHPTTLYNPPAIGYAWTPNNVPVIKKYNISVTGTGDLSRLAEIYEDILPPSAIAANRYTTLAERLVINNYVRSMIITKGDNEEIHMTGDATRTNMALSNIMSRIKFMDINPYHFSRLTNNMYRTISRNMVMFRTCYPIRFNSERIRVDCANDSLSMHVRIYSLSLFDKYITAGVSDKLKKTYSDVWREIIYYEKIKEDVIKKKVSPNFVTMYAYFRTQNSGINFQKVDELAKNYNNRNHQQITNIKKVRDEMFYEETINKAQEIAKDLVFVWGQGRVPTSDTNQRIQNNDPKRYLIDKPEEILKVKNEQCIVSITEGPTQNILNWATKTYNVDGVVRKQIQSGVYDKKVWMSVLFQLVSAMLVLEQQEIAFRDFSLANNVFIKDLNVDPASGGIGHWKYRINGIDFYVPNYGYLVLIDSSYPEANMDGEVDNLQFDSKHIKQLLQYKVYGSIFDDKYDDINTNNINTKKTEEDKELQKCMEEITIAMKNFDSINVVANQQAAVVSVVIGPVVDPGQVTVQNRRNDALNNLIAARDKSSKNVVVNIKFKDLIKKNQLAVFNGAEFNKAFQLYGGVSPPIEIMNIITNIENKIIKGDNLKKIILEEFKDYIHNKVGDILLEEEKLMLQPHNKDFVKGELVAYEISPDNFQWCIYTNTNEILVKEMPNKFEYKATTPDLINRIYGTLKQKYDANQKRSEEDILDTYTII